MILTPIAFITGLTIGAAIALYERDLAKQWRTRAKELEKELHKEYDYSFDLIELMSELLNIHKGGKDLKEIIKRIKDKLNEV